MSKGRKKQTQGQSNKEQDETENKSSSNIIWKTHETLFYGDSGTTPSSKVIGFDMDDTIIKTKSGAKFAQDAKDWLFLDAIVPKKIKELHEQGFKIVIFTNQNGISKGHTTASAIKNKIEAIIGQINCPIQALIASADDKYRKPSKELWNFFVEKLNENKEIDYKTSLFCGDAAGRLKPKKDFTDTDYKFAINCNLNFKTPEELFFGTKQTIPKIEFDPRNLKSKSISKVEENGVACAKGVKEMVIFVGSPASGKSTFWKNYLPDYVRVNRDTLKTREKCLKVAEESLVQGKNVVIDNTNPTAQDRKAFIDLALKYNYDLRAFYFLVEKALAFHNDSLREINIHRKHLSERVGSIPIHTFFKNCEIPTTKEGFKEVKTIEFKPGPFENKNDEEMFFSFVKGK